MPSSSRLIVATTEADEFGAIFAHAYRAAGGPPPDIIVVLPDRHDLGFPAWAAPWVWMRLLSPMGFARVVFARKLRRPLTARDRTAGLADDWIETLRGPATRVVRHSSINHADTVALLASEQPAVFVSIGVPEILKAPALAACTAGAINVHNGRLPIYRGHFATFWEVIRGEAHSYATIHRMTANVDQGAVLAEEAVAIREMPSFLDLMIEKKHRGGAALARVVSTFDASAPTNPTARETREPAAKRSYFGWPTLRDVRTFRWPRS
jgi:folate-dependent phosphoribosylglycinamide formyltransferase PurN